MKSALYLTAALGILANGAVHAQEVTGKNITLDECVRMALAKNLDLRLGSDPARTSLDVAAYLATLVTNYLHTGKFKRTV